MLRTAHQEKTLCRSCPLAKAAHLLGDTCSLIIVRDLLERPRRFGELQAALEGVSTRTLTNKLKLLEKSGIVRRTARPPAYTLTPKGKALKPVITSLRGYGQRYL